MKSSVKSARPEASASMTTHFYCLGHGFGLESCNDNFLASRQTQCLTSTDKVKSIRIILNDNLYLMNKKRAKAIKI